MELITREIQTNQMGKKVASQFVLDEDFNVPDSKRDVQRVIAGEGNIKITDIKVSDNYVKVLGMIEFQVLYVGEGLEASLCSMTGKLPFEENIYVEDSSGVYEIKNSRVELQVLMIHSRKLRVKAMVELEVESEKQTVEVLPIDVEGEADMFKKHRNVELLKLHMSKRDTYRIKEEIVLPESKECIGTILWSDVVNRKLDTKLVEDELQISGELLAFCFYESPDGKLDWIEKSVPYQGKIECYGANEKMYHQLQGDLEEINTDIRMDEDGEMRIIGIEGTLKLNVIIYEEEHLEMLEDVYSLKKQCRLEKKEVCYEQLILQNHSKCKVVQTLSLPELKNDILQVCHSSGNLQIEHVEKVGEGIEVEGVLHVKFLYVKANDEIPFEMWCGMVPFSHLIECKELDEDTSYQISGLLEQVNVNLLGGNEVEVKAGLAFQSFFRKMVKENMISALKLETMNMRELEKGPGVIGYIVKEGDDLWNLAKQYHTTMDMICKINELEEEKLKVGDRILIFKENVAIL